MKPAAFLDRDGTIIREVDNLRHARQIRLLPGTAAAIRRLNRMGFLVIVVTNQPVVARGWVKPGELESFHETLRRRLARSGARIDAIYYCPHHPQANLKEYRKICGCRKPKVGLFRKASRQFPVARAKSYAIGDRTVDLEAGRRFGVRTILVKTGYRGLDGKHRVRPDFTAADLEGAVAVIRRHER